MGLFQLGANFLEVRRTAAVLEAQLLKYRRGSYGIDLAEDPEDPTKTDPVMAAAVMKLLKKYGDRLVLSRFRGRVTVSWRAGTFSAVTDENRAKLEGVGFYLGGDATYEEVRSGVDPGQVGDPRSAQKGHDENRRARVRAWARKGWQGDVGWAAWGGDPESVKKLPEYAEYQKEQLAALGTTNVGGVDVTLLDASGAPLK